MIATIGRSLHFGKMPHPLLVRAQLAIEENSSLRDDRRALMKEQEERLLRLRLARLECAMTRAEIKTLREDRRSFFFIAYQPRRLGASNG